MSHEVSWQALEFVWRAKGLVRKEVSVRLQNAKECQGISGLSVAQISEKLKFDKVAPYPVVKVIKDLKPKPDSVRTAEVAMFGLLALVGEPLPVGVTPAQAAQDLRAEFPADAVAAKLAEALSKQGGPLDTLRAKFDALASSVGASVASLLAPVDRLGATLNALASFLLASLANITGKLDALTSAVGSVFATLAGIGGKLDAATGKLDAMAGQVDRVERSLAMVAATVNDVDAKADVAAFDSERAHRRVLRSVRFVGVLALLALVVALAVLVSGRSQWAPREQVQPTTANATQPPPVVVVTNGATGTVFNLSTFLGTVLSMGKKTQENWIPNEPLPFQKLAKDCDREMGEEPINGGCWFLSGAVAPPCGKLFRYGDKCYRPVAADPTKPVGGPIPGPVREGPWMAPGTTNDGRGGRE